MIGYTTIGTNNLDRARAFYDAALAPLGGRRTLTYERSQYYGSPQRGAMLGITLPFDGEAATKGNGVMVALLAESPAMVDQVYAAAIACRRSLRRPAGAAHGQFLRGLFLRLGRQQAVYLQDGEIGPAISLALYLPVSGLHARLCRRHRRRRVGRRSCRQPRRLADPGLCRSCRGIP